jgi:glycosyltransferase involved in cell wall biosynthesis
MNLIVTVNHRFCRTPEGIVWTYVQFPNTFWRRYLTIFDRVYVLARIHDVQSLPADWQRVDSDKVKFKVIPSFHGLGQYILRFQKIRRAIENAVDPNCAVILRAVSQVSNSVELILRHRGQPYAMEIVSDPYEGFAPGAISHPLRPFFRYWYTYQLRRQCTSACATAYVTEQVLQQRYPPAPGTFSTHYSSVELHDDAFLDVPRSYPHTKRKYVLVFVGALTQLKGSDVLIDAINVCARNNIDLELVMIGDGKLRAKLEARAEEAGLKGRIVFRGFLPAGAAVRDQLDQADLFVLPSRHEGLPRSMIEAMARALPCIGSRVGGIPELLRREDMVPPNDVEALANKIHAVVTDPGRMEGMSARNLKKVRAYSDANLNERRIEFYRYVQARTKDWLETRQG